MIIGRKRLPQFLSDISVHLTKVRFIKLIGNANNKIMDDVDKNIRLFLQHHPAYSEGESEALYL